MERGHQHCRLSLGAFCLLILWLFGGAAYAATLTVTWDANTEDDLAGYWIHYGTASGSYTHSVAVDKNATSHQLSGLAVCTTYYVAVTAFDTSGNQSDYSNEGSATTTCEGASTFWRDADGDGYGDPAVSIQSDEAPPGYVADNTDCNDANAGVHPGAAEVCDGIDNNCNGQVDEGLVMNTYFLDADGDGYGDAADALVACQAPAGYVSNALDCDDSDPGVHPGAVEVCGDGIDQDCSGADQPCTEHFGAAPPPASDYLVARGAVEAAGVPAQPGDEIAVYDAGGVCCGTFRLTQAGVYGPLHINLDDPATPQDEGAAAGDRLVFQVWDASTGLETAAHLEIVSQDGASYEVNLAGHYQETIPLRAGWNLVSFTTAVCYHATPEPPAVPMMEGIRYQQVADLNDVLSSIDNKYEVVRGFDAAGAHTYDPATPALNDLDYLAPGYGYWIKATEDCELQLTGGRVSPLSRRAVSSGWNLVGYWGHEVNHLGAEPEVGFASPPNSLVLNEVSEAQEIFGAITGMYRVINSFDADGAHSLRPDVPAFLSDLRYAGPGYGYWVRMNGNAQLSY